MKVSVEHPWLNPHQLGVHCSLDVVVVTGDGAKHEFRGDKGGLGSIPQCFDGALAHGAIAVLEDEAILRYLPE